MAAYHKAEEGVQDRLESLSYAAEQMCPSFAVGWAQWDGPSHPSFVLAPGESGFEHDVLEARGSEEGCDSFHFMTVEVSNRKGDRSEERRTVSVVCMYLF